MRERSREGERMRNRGGGRRAKDRWEEEGRKTGRRGRKPPKQFLQRFVYNRLWRKYYYCQLLL